MQSVRRRDGHGGQVPCTSAPAVAGMSAVGESGVALTHDVAAVPAKTAMAMESQLISASFGITYQKERAGREDSIDYPTIAPYKHRTASERM